MIFKMFERLERTKSTRIFSAALLCVFAMSSLNGCHRDPTALAQKHVVKARQYMKESRIDEAAIELRRAVQNNPRSSEAHFLLAEVNSAKGDLRGTAQELVLTLKNEPEHHEANLMLAELLVRSGNYANAETRAQFIRDKWPTDSRGVNLLAEAKAGSNDIAGATALLDERLKADPRDARALFDVATIEARDGKFREAEEKLREVRQLMPNSLPADVLLANILEQQGRKTEAEAALKEAVEKNQKNIPAHLFLFAYYVNIKRLDLAEPVIVKVKELNGGAPQYRTVLARFLAQTGRQADAEREYKTLLAGDTGGVASRELAIFYLNQSRIEEARKLVDQLLKVSANDAPALVLRGRIELSENHVSEAVEDLQRAVKSDPDSSESYLFLADGLQRLGKPQEAATTLNEALRRNPKSTAARMALVRQKMGSGQIDSAMQDLDKVITQSPLDLTPHLMMAQAMASKNDFAGADKKMAELLNAATQPKARATVYRSWALIKLRNRKPQEAHKYVTEALNIEPKSIEGLSLLEAAYLESSQSAAGLKDIEHRVESYPDWAAGYGVLGGMAMQAKRFDEAGQWLEKAQRLDPKEPSYQRMLAELYVAQNKPTMALSVYQTLASSNPKDVASLFHSAQLIEQSGDWGKAEALYKRCLELDPDNAAIKNNLAYGYLTNNGNTDVALKLAQEAKEKVPQDPRVNDTIAWAYVQKGSYTPAIEYLKQALETRPENPTYSYHLGYAYAKLGNNTEAKKALETALRTPSFVSSKDGNQAKMLLASMDK